MWPRRCQMHVLHGQCSNDSLSDDFDMKSSGLFDMHTHMDEPGREAWEGAGPVALCVKGNTLRWHV